MGSEGAAAMHATQLLKKRTVHLVDLENIVGSGDISAAAADHARAVYLASGLVATDDHVIVGISHHNLMAAGLAWSAARHVVRSGPNGADLALKDVMVTEHLEQRFGACILLTGDGGFAHSTAALINHGLPVGVVEPKGRLASTLRLAASASREIDFTSAVHTSRSA